MRCTRSTPSAARWTTSPMMAGRSPPRRAKLQRWREDIDAIYAGARAGEARRPCRRRSGSFDLRREDFHAVIDGMAMDLEQDIQAPDLATLDLYCDRVASAVGRLSVRVFGMEWVAGERLAHHLGRALQLTNILRDLDEDAGDRPALSAGRAAAGRRASRRPSRTPRWPIPISAAPARRWRTRRAGISSRPHASWRRPRARRPRRRASWARSIAASWRA